MAFFKTKAEKEIEQQMARDEQLEKFNEQIKSLENSRREYAAIAAKADMNGDVDTYNMCVNSLLELNNNISFLNQAKVNFDLINISNAIAVSMATAVNTLDLMANSKVAVPNFKKISKVNIKMQKYMRRIKISQSAMGSMLKKSNPANKARSPEEIATIRPLIDAEIAKAGGVCKVSAPENVAAAAPAESKEVQDMLASLQNEKDRII